MTILSDFIFFLYPLQKNEQNKMKNTITDPLKLEEVKAAEEHELQKTKHFSRLGSIFVNRGTIGKGSPAGRGFNRF